MFYFRFQSMRRGLRHLRGSVRSATDMIVGWLAHARLGPIPDGEAGRRQRRRWAWRHALRVRTGGTELDGRTFDVSAHGLGALLPQPLGVGTRVEISDGIDACWMPARVVYVRPVDELGTFQTGLQFLTPTEGDPDEILSDAT